MALNFDTLERNLGIVFENEKVQKSFELAKTNQNGIGVKVDANCCFLIV